MGPGPKLPECLQEEKTDAGQGGRGRRQAEGQCVDTWAEPCPARGAAQGAGSSAGKEKKAAPPTS